MKKSIVKWIKKIILTEKRNSELAKEMRNEYIHFLESVGISKKFIRFQSVFFIISLFFMIFGSVLAVTIPLRPGVLYRHDFIPDYVGFKKSAEVLLVNTPERRIQIQAAISNGYIRNEFNLNPIIDDGLYLREENNGKLNLYTSMRFKDVNRMVLVPMKEPLIHGDVLLMKDAVAYYGPRALQRIHNKRMITTLLRYRKMLFKDHLEVGGYISRNSNGTYAPYTPNEIHHYFSKILPIKEGRYYLEAQVDINNPDAEALLVEYFRKMDEPAL